MSDTYIKRHTCEFVIASDLVPSNWKGWFWEAFSTNAPFSWGDNNRTLVSAEEFLSHAAFVIDDAVNENAVPEIETQAFIETLHSLPPDLYIDLEN